jgi:hypothetical protein
VQEKKELDFYESNLFINHIENSYSNIENATYIFLYSPKLTDISFQYRTKNSLTDYIWANIRGLVMMKNFLSCSSTHVYIDRFKWYSKIKICRRSVRKKNEKAIKLLLNYEHTDYLLFSTKIFLVFLGIYEIHIRKVDVIKSNSYEIIYQKLWKEQEKQRKIDLINNYKEYWYPIVKKRNKFLDITGLTEKEIDEWFWMKKESNEKIEQWHISKRKRQKRNYTIFERYLCNSTNHGRREKWKTKITKSSHVWNI